MTWGRLCMVRKITLIGLALILLLTVLSRLTLAQSGGYLESRLSRLESDSFSIRSELARLEAVVAQLGNRSNSAPIAINPPSQASPRVNRPLLSSELTSSRLATLVVELKQRINNLEIRVNRLERR